MGRKSYSSRNLIKPLVARPVASSNLLPANVAPSWITTEEMAGRLKMSHRYFKRLVKAKNLPHRKYSRKMVRFDPVMVEAALTKCFEQEATQ